MTRPPRPAPRPSARPRRSVRSGRRSTRSCSARTTTTRTRWATSASRRSRRSTGATSGWTSPGSTAGTCTTARSSRDSRSTRTAASRRSRSCARGSSTTRTRSAPPPASAAATCSGSPPGRGVVHSEMFPLLDDAGPNPLELFQIWLNLPAADKMTDPYFTMLWDHDIPRVTADPAVDGRSVIAGRLGDVDAPPPPPNSWASRPEADLAIWLIRLDAGATWTMPAATGPRHGAHALLLRGRRRSTSTARTIGADTAALLEPHRDVALTAGADRGAVPPAPGPPDRRAGRALRPVRDEHPRRARAGVHRLPRHGVRRLAVARPTTPCTRGSRAASPATRTGGSRRSTERRSGQLCSWLGLMLQSPRIENSFDWFANAPCRARRSTCPDRGSTTRAPSSPRPPSAAGRRSSGPGSCRAWPNGFDARRSTSA